MDFDAESAFDQFLIENFEKICPVGGVISYVNGKVKCNVHDEIDEDKPSDEEVPWI